MGNSPCHPQFAGEADPPRINFRHSGMRRRVKIASYFARKAQARNPWRHKKRSEKWIPDSR
jgi:hypothetical protein